MKLILASSSKQRQEILKMIGLKYEVITSQVQEESKEHNPSKYVEQIALDKAKSVCEQIKEKAINNMKELSGKKNTAYTGISIIDLYKEKTLSFSTKVDVYLKSMTDEEINWYVNCEDKIFKCCGYVPLGKASIFIEKVDVDYNTLFGISPSVLFEKVKELGYDINDFEFEKNYER